MLSTWLQMNVLIAIVGIFLWMTSRVLKEKSFHILSKDLMLLFPLILISPIVVQLLPIEVPLPPVVTKAMVVAEDAVINVGIQPSLVVAKSKGLLREAKLTLPPFALVLFTLGLSLWGFVSLLSFLKLKKIITDSFLYKKTSQTDVLIHQGLKVPFSTGIFRKYIVIPQDVLINSKNKMIAFQHEAQHLRQGDTYLIVLIELFRALFFLNPFAHYLIRLFSQVREVTCDENVLSRKNVSAQDYTQVLIDVVKINSGEVPHGAWAMASQNFTFRRCKMILTKDRSKKTFLRVGCALLLGTLLWQSVWAMNGRLTGKKLSLYEARELVAEMDSKIPIEVNEVVLKWLNYYLADPKGKAYVLKTKERMDAYENTISKILYKEDMPKELLAVPFMESGYHNGRTSYVGAAGLWQFMPGTAKVFGLAVRPQLDERYHVPKATKAAIAYYRKLLKIKEFEGNWHLALLSYNTGEGRLKKAIRRQGTSNPWAFNKLGDKDYLAKIMAGMILLKMPEERF